MIEPNNRLALPPFNNKETNQGALPAVPEQVTIYPSYTVAETEEEPTVPLSHYLWILRRNKWRILAFVLTCTAATMIVSARLTPIYESTSTVDIDRQAPPAVVGQESARTAPNDADQFLATQIKIIQSDSVLRPVSLQYHLSTVETGTGDQGVLQAERVLNAPITLKNLKVTRPPNTYLLLISYRSTIPQVAADVSNGIAESYIQHTYDVRFRATAGLSSYMEKQIEELKAKMEISSAALARFERDLSVINPEEKTSILSSRLLQLNTEFTSAQADRVRKQAALNLVKSGSQEAAQASTQGEQLRRLAERIDEAREKFSIIKIQYGTNHPEYKKTSAQVSELQRQFDALKNSVGQRVSLENQEALSREGMLKDAVSETKAEFDRINARSFEYKTLKQEADSDKNLYQELVLKIKEAGINSSFQNSSIRLSDSARPGLKPVFPNIPLNTALALLFSAVLAVGAAVTADVLDNTVRDPEQIQKGLKTEVIGSLPLVRHWRGRIPKFVSADPGSTKGVIRLKFPQRQSQAAAFEEAVRTLRDSILLSDPNRKPGSILITSAAPREGKTICSVQLAISHSLQRRKTLLIDADLRRPSIHERFGVSNNRGLSTVVNETVGWRDVLQRTEVYPDLDILTGGPASRRAADRLGATLETILADAAKDYDLVIIDSPPLLGFAEPLQMASVVDGIVIVTLAAQTSRTALASVIATLKRLRTNVIGVALNEVHEDMSDRYYYYGYYGKYYSKYYKPANS